MNIVLIGMRGSGKTTVGKLLARRLGKQFIEMDELIVQRIGLDIPEIVKRYGWEKFREVEEEVTREVAELDNVVNATGGGVVTREENVRELKKKGKLVWLKANTDTLLRRIDNDEYRPSLTGRSPREDLEAVLAERTPIYEQVADFIIETEGKKPEEVAEAIAKQYSEQWGLMIDANTTICCLIGDPVEYSLSPLVHNHGYEVLGLNFVYVAFRVNDIKLAIDGIRALGIRGASITMPHKVSAMKYIDDIDDTAQKIGAINIFENDTCQGPIVYLNFEVQFSRIQSNETFSVTFEIVSPSGQNFEGAAEGHKVINLRSPLCKALSNDRPGCILVRPEHGLQFVGPLPEQFQFPLYRPRRVIRIARRRWLLGPGTCSG